MSSEFHSCQHPFGDGVHVVVLSPRLACVFIELLEIEKDVGQAYSKLLGMTAPHQVGHMCGLYQGKPPDPAFTSAWLALKLSCRGSDKEEHNPQMRGIAVFSDPGFEELAKAAAKAFRQELKAIQLLPEEE